MRRSSFHASFLSLAIAATACGGSVSDSGGNGEEDTGTPGEDTGTPGDDTGLPPGDDTGLPPDDTTPPPVDGPGDPHGVPSDTYPAFAPDLPLLQYGGGTLLKNPVIVTITYDADPSRAE